MLSRPQSIVLVCANSPEMCTPDGLCTGALAIAYAKRGHRVRVLCSANSAYEPWRSHAGSISVHRIDSRKGAGEHGFAALAIGRVVELARIGQTGQTGQTGHCDVIECVDVPSCALGLGALRRSGVVQTPIVSVVVDRALHASATGQAARRVCDATVYTQKPSEDDAGCVIPFPIEPDAWNPPSSDGSMFVCCDANGDGVDHSFLTEAFELSDARMQGWSLALMNASGRWTVLSGSAHVKVQSSKRTVVVSASRASPVAPAHALGTGDLCLLSDQVKLGDELGAGFAGFRFCEQDVGSLAQPMRAIVELSDEDYLNLGEAFSGVHAHRHESSEIVDAHELVWKTSPTKIGAEDRAAVWKSLELVARGMSSGYEQRGAYG